MIKFIEKAEEVLEIPKKKLYPVELEEVAKNFPWAHLSPWGNTKSSEAFAYHFQKKWRRKKPEELLEWARFRLHVWNEFVNYQLPLDKRTPYFYAISENEVESCFVVEKIEKGKYRCLRLVYEGDGIVVPTFILDDWDNYNFPPVIPKFLPFTYNLKLRYTEEFITKHPYYIRKHMPKIYKEKEFPWKFAETINEVLDRIVEVTRAVEAE